MHWKFKALIQNLTSMLPDELSYQTYYALQRRFGALRQVNPTTRLKAGIEAWKRIGLQGHSPLNKVFFEVGTGRIPIVPLSYWLMGAKRTITVDLNPYLKEDLTFESVKWMAENQDQVFKFFGALLNQERFEILLNWFTKSGFEMLDFLDLCQIHYMAPCDATKTGLLEKTIDYHTSYTVLEHIPPEVLMGIFREGNRLVKDSGLFVHKIDYSDHFSHSDKNISAINFLSYDERQWKRWAGNRYMYMNRLRHDDFFELFNSLGFNLLAVEPHENPRLDSILNDPAFELDHRFRQKTRQSLRCTGAWFVASPPNI